MVEYPAPGGVRQPEPIAQDGYHDADGHADHVDCMLDVRDRRDTDTHPCDYPGGGASYGLGWPVAGSGAMNWTSLSDFLDMGGYGLYVWGSYLVFLVCIAGEIILVFNRKRTLLRHLSLIHESTKQEKRHETAS